ncbi:MAG: hypothetical protein LBL41_04175 [Bifidobacteriaceae bacterium]|nr:hypothetical protein [Bifidobacteriaceae bacterium]
MVLILLFVAFLLSGCSEDNASKNTAEYLKFTLGTAVDSVQLGTTYSNIIIAADSASSLCEYSIDGETYTPVPFDNNGLVSFSADTNTIYFKGDCRNSGGSIAYMFDEAFPDNSVQLSGSILAIMGGEPLTTVNSMFSGTFYKSRLTEIPADLFAGISGEPKENMFFDTFAFNKLASIPDGLFSGISGAPAEGAFGQTFYNTPYLNKIGDLGMDITESTVDESVYSAMFGVAGRDESVTEITVPEGGLINLFTEPGNKFTSLVELYNGNENGAFSDYSALGMDGWSTKYSDYNAIPDSWK